MAEAALDAALFHDPRRRMIAIRDGEIAALDFGDAARPVDVVFLHANGFNAMTYRSILGPLSLSMRILACDLRGHGASKLPADAAEPRRSWSLFRDDLLAVLETLGDRTPVLSGHSLGATTALLAAAAAPERAKSLVLFEPVILTRPAAAIARLPWTAGRSWRRLPIAATAAKRRSVFASARDAFQAYQGRGAFRTWPEIMLADYLAGGLKERSDGAVELSCAPAWEAANFAAQDNDARGALRRFRAPVKVFRAESHSTCGLRRPGGSGRRKPHLQVASIPGTTHFLPMERPDLVRDALLDAVDG
jgi:pimeloyl-ACP methyl ester carboxylesterase